MKDKLNLRGLKIKYPNKKQIKRFQRKIEEFDRAMDEAMRVTGKDLRREFEI